MEATTNLASPPKVLAQERLEEELATLSAHINAATARWLELVLEFRAEGGAAIDGLERWLSFRCGIWRERRASTYGWPRRSRSCQGSGALSAAGQLTYTKVRTLSRVATPASEQALLELASALTASQLERALRAFRRIQSDETGEAHALEYVDYHWAEDGAARDRVPERRRQEQPDAKDEVAFEPARDLQVEALIGLAQAALASPEYSAPESACLVVHVDAAALTADCPGRSELEAGPVISPETARRLGCDAERVTMVERDGSLVSVGRRRRTVPPTLRRLVEARDDGSCRWPGYEPERPRRRDRLRHGDRCSRVRC